MMYTICRPDESRLIIGGRLIQLAESQHAKGCMSVGVSASVVWVETRV
jgi:hypothetical protein